MRADHPVLTVLGRRGRGAVVDALAGSDRTWNIRDLARAADVSAMTASRAVAELAALGAVESFRPGRDQHVRWRSGPMARLVASIDLADPRQAAAAEFAAAFTGPGRLMHWQAPDDEARDPATPTRIAVIVDDVDAAVDAVSGALGKMTWPAPDVSIHAALADDEIGQAIQTGRHLSRSPAVR